MAIKCLVVLTQGLVNVGTEFGAHKEVDESDESTVEVSSCDGPENESRVSSSPSFLRRAFYSASPLHQRRPSVGDAIAHFDSKRLARQELEKGIVKFGINPKRGIGVFMTRTESCLLTFNNLDYLVKVGHLKKTVGSVTKFLLKVITSTKWLTLHLILPKSILLHVADRVFFLILFYSINQDRCV